MTYYLYKKTHKITGLKYLGKTKRDPFKYKGSGTKWCAHINKHGYEVETEILKECQTNDDIKHWGLYYSKLWNVVESDEWANLKEESGDGGDTSMSEGFLEKIPLMTELAKKRKWWNNGLDEQHTEFQPGTDWVRGRLLTTDNKHNTGKRYWNNGVENTLSITSPGIGWVLGMLSIPESRMWTDGKTNTRSVNSPGEGWRLGFTKKWDGHLPTAKGLKWWNNGKEKLYCAECPGDGWILGRGGWWTNDHEDRLCFQSPGPDWRKGRHTLVFIISTHVF